MKIKIRFVERCSQDGEVKDYLIQKKGLFGWKYIKWIEEMGHGSIVYFYCDNQKSGLLDLVLEKHFRTTKKFCSITEYPSLRIY